MICQAGTAVCCQKRPIWRKVRPPSLTLGRRGTPTGAEPRPALRATTERHASAAEAGSLPCRQNGLEMLGLDPVEHELVRAALMPLCGDRSEVGEHWILHLDGCEQSHVGARPALGFEGGQVRGLRALPVSGEECQAICAVRSDPRAGRGLSPRRSAAAVAEARERREHR